MWICIVLWYCDCLLLACLHEVYILMNFKKNVNNLKCAEEILRMSVLYVQFYNRTLTLVTPTPNHSIDRDIVSTRVSYRRYIQCTYWYIQKYRHHHPPPPRRQGNFYFLPLLLVLLILLASLDVSITKYPDT